MEFEKKYSYAAAVKSLESLSFLPLLLLRLTLAYGFYNPAVMKWNNIEGIGEWFESMGIPIPYVSAYMAAGVEALGVALLPLGLGVRLISIPLIGTMIVAIKTVHWQNGFDASANGYEIPLYYALMLFTLLTLGPGKVSLDHLIQKWCYTRYYNAPR